MNLSPENLRELSEIACSAAKRAGQWIAERRPTRVQHKEGALHLASQVVTEVDRQSEDILVECLHESADRYDFGLLTEESPDDGARLEKEFFWCVDPLDGTLPYIENKPGYSVVISLIRRDGVPMLGVVYDPLSDTVYSAIHGVVKVARPRPFSSADLLSVYFDRSFLDDEKYSQVYARLEELSEEMGLGGVRVHVGAGAAMNACWAISRSPSCYFKFPKEEEGGGCIWDFAASACLYRASGLIATDILGNALDLNRADSCFMNHRGVLFASDAHIAQEIRLLYRDLA